MKQLFKQINNLIIEYNSLSLKDTETQSYFLEKFNKLISKDLSLTEFESFIDSFNSSNTLNLQNLNFEDFLSEIHNSEKIFTSFILNNSYDKIESNFSLSKELNDLIKEMKLWEKNELFLLLDTYFKNQFRYDYEEGLFSEFLIESDGIKLKSIKDSFVRDFYSKILNRINERSLSTSNSEVVFYSFDNKSNPFYGKEVFVKNGILFIDSISQGEVTITKDRLKTENLTINIKTAKSFKINKTYFSDIFQSGKVKSAAAGSTDMVFYDKEKGRILATDTTIAKNSSIEGDSQRRHYLNQIALQEISIDSKKIKELLREGIEAEELKKKLSSKIDIIHNLTFIDTTLKTIFILKELDIPLSSYDKIESIKIDSKEITSSEDLLSIKEYKKIELNGKEIKELNIDSRMEKEISLKTERTLKYSFRANSFNSLLDNVYFLLSHTAVSSKIGKNITTNTSIAAFKEFYSAIDKEVVAQGKVESISGAYVSKILDLIEDIIKGNKTEEDIVSHISKIKNKEDFSSVFLAISQDLIKNSSFELEVSEIERLEKILNNIPALQNSVSQKLAIYELKDYTSFSLTELSLELINNLEFFKENIYKLGLDLKKEKLFLSRINSLKEAKEENDTDSVELYQDNLIGILKREFKENKKPLINILSSKSSNLVVKNFKKEKELSIILEKIESKEQNPLATNLFEANLFDIYNSINDLNLEDNSFYTKEFIEKAYNHTKSVIELKQKENKELYSNEDIKVDKLTEIKSALKERYPSLEDLFTDNYISELIEKTYNNSIEKAFEEIVLRAKMSLKEYKLNGVDRVSDSIAQAIKEKREIIFFVDNDADGSSAYASIYASLVSLGVSAKIFYTKDTATVRGINFEQVKGLVEAKDIKTKNPLIVTADNGVNNIEEYPKIKELLPGVNLEITDHHPFDNYDNFNFYKENDYVNILNGKYDLTGNEIKENRFSISGASVISKVMLNLIEDNDTEETILNIMEMSDFFDLVSIEDSNLDSIESSLLQKMSAEINCVPGFEKFIDSELNLSDSLKSQIYSIKGQINLLVEKFQEGNLGTIEKDFANFKASKDSKEVNMFDQVTYIRYIYIYLAAKVNKTPEEETFYLYLKNTLQKAKKLEKKIVDSCRNEYQSTVNELKEDIYKEIDSKHGTIQIFRPGLGNKFYRKVFPVSNKGFLINGSFNEKENMYSGSFRGLEFSYKDIFGEQFSDSFEMKGQDMASGFKVFFKEGENREKRLLEIIEKANKRIDILKKEKVEQENTVISIDKLSEINKLEKELKTSSNIKNFKKEYLISYSDLINFSSTKDVTNSSVFDIQELKTFNYHRFQLSFEDLNIIVKDSDIQNLKEGDYLKVKYVSDSLFFSEGVKDSNIEIHNEIKSKNSSMKDYQIEEHKRKFNKENNFTIEISKESFIKRQNLNNLKEEEIEAYFEDIKNLLEQTNKDKLVILDIEGTGFGKKTKMFNYGSYSFELEDGELKIKNTSILIDIQKKLTGAIQSLTDIESTYLSKYGISEEETDKILSELYSDNCIFQAHNIAYDFNGIKANLPKFSENMKNGMKIDSATYSRNLKLANDSNIEYLKLSINTGIKNIELGNYFNFGTDSISNFLRRKEIGSVFKDKSNKKSLKWEIKNGFTVLEFENGKEREIFTEEEVLFSLKKKFQKMPVKYSVQEILKQEFIKIIRKEIVKDFTKEEDFNKGVRKILKKDNPSLRKFIDSIVDFEDIEKSTEHIYKNILVSYLREFNIEISVMEEEKEIIKRIKQLEKIGVITKKVLDSKLSSFAEIKSELAQERRELERYIKGNEIPLKEYSLPLDALFSNSSELKKILIIFNEKLTLEENVLNVRKETSLNQRTAEIFVDYVYKINKKYEEGNLDIDINEELFKAGITLHKNFKELHNNIEENFADVTYESIIMLLAKKKFKKYSNDSFNKFISESLLDTEKKMSSLNVSETTETENGYTYRQGIERGEFASEGSNFSLKSSELNNKEIVISSDYNIDFTTVDFQEIAELIEAGVKIDKINNSIVFMFDLLKRSLKNNFEIDIPSFKTINEICSYILNNRIFLTNTVNEIKENIGTTENKREVDKILKIESLYKDLRFFADTKNTFDENASKIKKAIKNFGVIENYTKTNKVFKKYLDFILSYDKIEKKEEALINFLSKNKITAKNKSQEEIIIKEIKSFISKTELIRDIDLSDIESKIDNSIFKKDKNEIIQEKYTKGLKEQLISLNIFYQDRFTVETKYKYLLDSVSDIKEMEDMVLVDLVQEKDRALNKELKQNI